MSQLRERIALGAPQVVGRAHEHCGGLLTGNLPLVDEQDQGLARQGQGGEEVTDLGHVGILPFP